MKTLPAGNRKYLLLDPERILANTSRSKAGSPIAIVIEEVVDKAGTGYVQYRGHGVLVEGPVSLEYGQRNPIVSMYRRRIHAAYVTTGAVVLSETPDEPLALPEATTPADPPAKPKATSKK